MSTTECVSNTKPVRFFETKRPVRDFGSPPDSFLEVLVDWAKREDVCVFDRNDEPDDIFALIQGTLGPWQETLGEAIPKIRHRTAAMLEAIRVHAGFESSWDWTEGVDTTNKSSMRNKTGEETGIFQVSFDSEWIEHEKIKPWALSKGLSTPEIFIARMKSDHLLALQYYARLIRINVRWAGPLVRREILDYLRFSAVDEFMRLLA